MNNLSRLPLRPRMARVLDLDPELGAGLADEQRAQARRICAAELVGVAPGEWNPVPADLHADPDTFALILTDGLLAREMAWGRHRTLELLCPGDVVLPSTDDPEALLSIAPVYTALTRLTAMALGTPFLRAADRWPPLLRAVTERVARQHGRLAGQALSLQSPRAEHRILLVLWLLSERCGRMTPDGVLLPLRLTHETLSRMTGARRPTVSLALGQLRSSGCVIERGDGFILSHDARRQIEALGAPHHAVPPVGASISAVPRRA